MKISELINHLEKIKQENGDLPVLCIEDSYDWDELPVGEKETKVLTVEGWRSPICGMKEGEKYVMIKGD